MPNDRGQNSNEISIKEAYEAIRNWYQSNIPLIELIMGRAREIRLGLGGDVNYFDKDHSRRLSLIRALPRSVELTELECRAVFDEVICGVLECGYGESDGHFTMAEYAHSAQHSLLTEDERISLQGSQLWPYFSFNPSLN